MDNPTIAEVKMIATIRTAKIMALDSTMANRLKYAGFRDKRHISPGNPT